MKELEISLVIPVYNVEKCLVRCLNSVINQTFTDLEIICINDGSEDNSLSILQEYSKKDERIRIINQQNAGLSAVRNVGIDVARGKYISFIDSDDWIDLDFCEKLYSSAEKYSADIAVGGIIRACRFKRKYFLRFEEEKVSLDLQEKFDICDVPERCYVWNKIYRLDKLRETNLRFLEGRVFEDIIFTPRVLYSLGKLVTVPNVYYYYWENPNSIVKSPSETNKQDRAYAFEETGKFLKEHNINPEIWATKLKRFKFLGCSILKIKTKRNKKQYILFNIFKFGRI